MSVTELNIEDYIYIKLDIESSPVPATMNIIKRIELQDGFGISVPTLRMELYDQKGSLMNDLMITDGTKIKIKISKKSQSPKSYKFRVFNFGQRQTHTGPVLEIIAILDIPKYTAAVKRKAYKGTSSSVMGQLAGEAGLQFSGPSGSTSDNMTWLCVCETLNSFSEDVAMYGYSSKKSCMSRLVTLDKKLLYKDLFAELRKSATATIRHNQPASSGASEGAPYASREVTDASVAGVMNHYTNYGMILAYHTLEGKPKKITEATPPRLGKNLPINSSVKGDVENARIEYGMHFDPGHAPKPGSNIHKNWEQARYQNTRFLGLFTERLRVLVEDLTVVKTWDPVKLLESEYNGDTLKPNKRTSGKYLCGGKTITVINGSRYYEVLDLYRPYLNNQGSTPLL